MEFHGHEVDKIINGLDVILRRLDLNTKLAYELLRKGEKIMAAIDDLKAAVASVQEGLDAVANDVTRVVGILQNTGSTDPAIVEATTTLTGIADKLKAMDAAIDAVSPDAPPTP